MSFSVIDVYASRVAGNISESGAAYTSVLYDSTNGLPTSEANCIVQTEDGFIWMGGYSGLIRYDGNEFYRYPSSTGISSVVSLFVDSKERIWIGTNDTGVAVMEGEEIRFYGRVEGLKSSSIRSVTEDNDGNILIATTQGLAYVDNTDVLHVLDDPQLNKEYICELIKGNDGIIYGETLSGAFFTIEGLRASGYYSGVDLGIGVISTIYPDPDKKGYVYLGTEESDILYGQIGSEAKDFEKISAAPLDNINVIKKVENNVWVCSDTGIGFFNKDGKFRELENVHMKNSVDDMMVDYEGNLWFTSSRQGVMKIVENRFTDISILAGLNGNVVNTTFLSDGLLYVGTDRGLIILDEDYNHVENDLTELLKEVRIRCIKSDSKGNIWLCTYSENGLVCYKGEDDITVINEENGLPSNRVRTVEPLSDGDLAVTTSGGLCLISNGKVKSVYGNAQGISNTEILSVEESPDGRLYLGSDGDGIYVVDGQKVSRLGLDDGLKSEVVMRIKRDPYDDTYWIITSNSIAYMKNDVITTVNNFPYSNNFDIFSDSKGRLWVLGSSGIYVVNKDVMFDDEENMEYILYDTKSGLPCVATANSRSFLTAEGTLYIASVDGVSSININEDIHRTGDIKIAIPFINVDDELIYTSGKDEIVIPKSAKRVIIYPYVLTYALQNPPVSMFLDGFDTEPLELTKEELTEIPYTNLPGGRYEFQMSLMNTLTGEADQTAKIVIIKEKHWYESVWFWIVILILFLGLIALAVYIFIQEKTKKLLKKQRENEELIDEMCNVFGKCIDMKDPYTNGHSERVAKYTVMLARKLGKNKSEVKELYHIALMHDIGKISIPDAILNKDRGLTDDEYKIMKSHAARGGQILKDIRIAPNIGLGARYHHERIDGKGYPEGLKGDEIPEEAQIIAVADTFDAMYSTRPYRKRMDLNIVADEIRKAAGTQLNAEIVKVFLELVDEGAFSDENMEKDIWEEE